MKPTSQDNPPQTGAPELEPDIERELLRAYIDSANDGIFVVCDEMKFHVANPLLSNWIGVGEAELTAHGQRVPITEVFGLAETEAVFCQHFQTALDGQAVCFEVDMTPPRGEPRWVEVSMSRVGLETGKLVIGILRDITERRLLQSQLQHHASHDDLTGLMNRREFQQRLQALVETAQADRSQHALVYVDLNQFKVVNDTCGHLAGDELLRQLGRHFLRHIRSRDVIARLGGDEFGLLLHNLPIETAAQIANSLCESVAKYRFVWEERCFEVTASIGLCAINGDTLSAEEALSAADAACYVAKDQGRNRTQLYFGGVVCTGKRQEMEWVSRLHKALDDSRFQIWQQQVIALANPQAAPAGHFEILLRLVDEDGTLVIPERFFPAAERYGLMPAIDRWVIQSMLLGGQGKRLQREIDRTSATHCAINLSGASLNDDKFLAFLEDALKHSEVAGDRLCFEITETVAINNFVRISEVMQRLKQFGCQFALDDFGSGMSSFSYLKHLPVDYLKIDGTLVRNIVEDAADFAMVEAINRIGGVLGLKTIAEFVETEATLERLRDIGIDYAQGFAVHRPEALFTDCHQGNI